MNLLKSTFLKSASIIFVSNISVAILNYSLVLVASRKLVDSYSLWTALSGLIAICSTPAYGVYTSLTRSVSVLSQTSLSHVQSYFQSYQKKIIKLWPLALIALPIASFFLHISIAEMTYPIAFLTVFYLITSIFFGLKHNVLMGLLRIKEYSITNTVAAFLRLIIGVTLLFLGVQLWALPIALFTNSIVIYFLGSYFLNRVYTSHNIPKKSNSEYKIDIKNELIGVFFTTAGLFMLNTLLYLGL